VAARDELGQPHTQTGRLLGALLQDRACTLDEQSSQVGVPTFADTEQLLLATSGVLTWNYPHPGGELPPLMEGPSVPDGCDDCGRRHRSDARDGHQPLTGFVFATRNGTPWDANLLVKRKFRPMLRQLNIQECGLHAFRHANASLMDELSVPMKVRQQRLGHSDPRLTMNTYTHMASSDDERTAEQLGEILDAVGQNTIETTKGKGPAFQQALVN
jgi:hypothetical protein